MRKAADQIERLEKALNKIQFVPSVEMLTDFHTIKKMSDLARAALQDTPNV